MLLVNSVSDVVLERIVPDEGMKEIRTSGMMIALGRHSLGKLSGLPIKINGGEFRFPADSDLQITNTSFVDTKVSM